MISPISELCNLPKSISFSFKELGIYKALTHANIYKRNGIAAKHVFTALFALTFRQMSWNQFMNSKYKNDLPGKDCGYRFLNSSKFNWRKFLLEISSNAVDKVDPLTCIDRIKVFIVDDSPYNRSRSKKTDMLSKIFDHVTMKYFNGYHLLTLGWSDGATFLPVDFSLQATMKNLINGIDEKLDKRTLSYKRRFEATQSKTGNTIEMVKRALNKGINAQYVLMDSWFASPKMFVKMKKEAKIDALCQLKKTSKQHYIYQGKKYDVKSLFDISLRTGKKERNKDGIISSIIVNIDEETKLKIVFVVNRNDNSEWIAIGTTDITLSDEDIITVYSLRWAIEVFFKSIKQYFGLEKEFITNSFESLISHTTIVFVRYIVVAWETRKDKDPKTAGGFFLELWDEMAGASYIEALNLLLKKIKELSEGLEREIQVMVGEMLTEWEAMLPTWLTISLGLSSTLTLS